MDLLQRKQPTVVGLRIANCVRWRWALAKASAHLRLPAVRWDILTRDNSLFLLPALALAPVVRVVFQGPHLGVHRHVAAAALAHHLPVSQYSLFTRAAPGAPDDRSLAQVIAIPGHLRREFRQAHLFPDPAALSCILLQAARCGRFPEHGVDQHCRVLVVDHAARSMSSSLCWSIARPMRLQPVGHGPEHRSPSRRRYPYPRTITCLALRSEATP